MTYTLEGRSGSKEEITRDIVTSVVVNGFGPLTGSKRGKGSTGGGTS